MVVKLHFKVSEKIHMHSHEFETRIFPPNSRHSDRGRKRKPEMGNYELTS